MLSRKYLGRTMTRLLEVMLSGGVGIIAWWRGADINETLGGQILASFTGVSGTLLGFAIAALSILMAIHDSTLLRNLAKTGHRDILFHELFLTASAFLIALLISVFGLFFPPNWKAYALGASAAALVMALMLLLSSGRKFYKVLKFIK